MATTNSVEVRVNLRKNNNEKSDQFGKYYPKIDRKRTLSLKGLAKHISDHGSIYTRDVVEGVLSKLTICVPELLAQGVPVKLDGLGTFYPSIEAVPGGIESIAVAKELVPADTVKGVHVRFTPEGSDLDNITSRVFKEKCSLIWGDEIEITGYKDPDKKKGAIYRKTPISNPIVTPEPEPEP
jgi:predicted histone-like DNA-binding protein